MTIRSMPRRALLLAAIAACALFAGPSGPASGDDSDGGAPAADPKALVAKLGDADEAVRKAAADELVKLGAAAVPALATALADSELSAAAAAVIERMGPTAKAAAPQLKIIVVGAESPARTAAVRAVGSIGAAAVSVLPDLASIVRLPGAKDRADAATSIRQILFDVARAQKTGLSKMDGVIAAGCGWLMRHQSTNGSWDCKGFAAKCQKGKPCEGPGQGEYDLGVTGLATLALLGCQHPAVADGAADLDRLAAIDAALRWIAESQDADGHLGPWKEAHQIYGHAFGTLALADATARTGRTDLRQPLESAVQWILDAQNPGRGWRYGIRDGNNDTSVTTVMTRALLRAEDAGLTVKPDWKADALAWVDSMTDPEFGRIGYQHQGGGPSRTTLMEKTFPCKDSESATVSGLLVKLGLGRTIGGDGMWMDRTMKWSLELTMKQLPRWEPGLGTTDIYYWMHGSEVFRLLGPLREGEYFKKWQTDLHAALLPHQIPARAGCDAGSWPPEDAWSYAGGRVYATAASLLSLEACRVPRHIRPRLPVDRTVLVDALTKAASDSDGTIRASATRALDLIRDAYGP